MRGRLCSVVHGPFPLAEPRVSRQAKAALSAGWDVDVLALREPGDAAFEIVEGVRVWRAPLRHRRGVGFVRVAFEYLGFTLYAVLWVGLRSLSSRTRYDVLQVNNPPDFLVAAGLLPRLLGTKVLFDVHDLSEDMFAMRFGQGWLAGAAASVLRRIENATLGMADRVITVHRQYAQVLTRRDPSVVPVVVMNAVDETLLPPEKNIEGRPEVVYHGTLTKTYGLHLLIDAFSSAAARQEDLRLMIYGDGDERSALMHQADGLGIGDRVKFSAGYLPQRAALAAVAGAAVGVIPNLPTPLNRYALSSKLFEYVALGIPAVCADLPTLRAHFSEDEVVFFRPGCARSLADGLIATLGDPDAARSRAERARARYVEQYSWSSSAATYLSLLDEMQRSG